MCLQYGNILAGPQLSVTSSAATQSLAVLPQNPALSLKIISSKKKSEYAIQNLRLNAWFSSLKSLKEQVLSKCDGKASVDSGFGYIEPGHGVKGKQRWLMSDEDVVDMYTIHDGKKEILLWCYSQDGSKRPRSPDNADEGSTSQKRSRYNKQVDKMREVDEIEDDLRSKHEGKYSEEQIRMWAHLIQMNKHSSLEEPPNKKFWKTSGGTGCADAAAGSGQGSSKGVLSSPGKRVNLRGQCIDQLHRLQQLYNDGGITEDQYLDMKESIMKEVKKFE